MTVVQLARCTVSRRISRRISAIYDIRFQHSSYLHFSAPLRQYSIMLLSQPDSEPWTLIRGLTFYRYSRASTTESLSTLLMSGSQECLPQPVDQMMARVTDELKNVTYRVDLTAEGAILHTDPNTGHP